MQIAIIGGGAAGFFAAISAKESFPDASVTIYEKSNKVLSKVKVSGGGRCNVTHACFNSSELSNFYPRGGNFLKKAFRQFNAASTVEWFQKRSVPLVTLPDNCMFPASDSSQTIINCFVNEINKLGVKIQLQAAVTQLFFHEKSIELMIGEQTVFVDRVIVTTGGQAKKSGLDWLNHTYVDPVPSLFTFNMPSEKIKELMGIVVNPAKVKIEGEKLEADGPLLITHWGMSGPAILKLSAWGARLFAEKEYNFYVLVSWITDLKEEDLRKKLLQIRALNPSKKVSNLNPFSFPNRLWHFLLEKLEMSPELKWIDLGSKTMNRLVNVLLNDRYEVRGKTTFKEEFVTAGGISLSEIDVQTMQSKKHPGIFFAGEVMDIDGVTGGFNFQAAWTTAWIAGRNVGKLR
jgi:predicted Rossmann fold flavoprotein